MPHRTIIGALVWVAGLIMSTVPAMAAEALIAQKSTGEARRWLITIAADGDAGGKAADALQSAEAGADAVEKTLGRRGHGRGAYTGTARSARSRAPRSAEVTCTTWGPCMKYTDILNNPDRESLASVAPGVGTGSDRVRRGFAFESVCDDWRPALRVSHGTYSKSAADTGDRIVRDAQ